jgi:hypothetical protein
MAIEKELLDRLFADFKRGHRGRWASGSRLEIRQNAKWAQFRGSSGDRIHNVGEHQGSSINQEWDDSVGRLAPCE